MEREALAERLMRILGIETSCDETSAVGRRRNRRRGHAVGDSLQRRSPRRCRFTASGAASCPSSRRGSTSATSAASSSARSTKRRRPGRDLGAVAVTQGPGLGRLAADRRRVREGRGRRRRLAARRGPSSGRPHRIARAAERRAAAAGASSSSCPGGHTSLYLVERPGRYRAAQPHARRCGGRGVRQGREAARPRLSGRTGDRSSGQDRERPRGSRCRRRG